MRDIAVSLGARVVPRDLCHNNLAIRQHHSGVAVPRPYIVHRGDVARDRLTRRCLDPDDLCTAGFAGSCAQSLLLSEPPVYSLNVQWLRLFFMSGLRQTINALLQPDPA